MPLHLVTVSKMLVVFAFLASYIYLLGLFGIGFFHSFIFKEDDDIILKHDSRMLTPCAQALNYTFVTSPPLALVIDKDDRGYN